MKHIHIPETLTLMEDMRLPSYVAADSKMVVLTTDFQRQGRGQHDHKWESSRGENLLVGIILHHTPAYPAARQKQISDDVANAIRASVEELLPPAVGKVWVKPPNDIYVEGSKIAGILIEHDVQSAGISCTRIGLGINVNQTKFLSDAPNPCSLASLTGNTFNTMAILDLFLRHFEECCRVSKIL